MHLAKYKNIICFLEIIIEGTMFTNSISHHISIFDAMPTISYLGDATKTTCFGQHNINISVVAYIVGYRLHELFHSSK
jgi:hypothetical protein